MFHGQSAHELGYANSAVLVALLRDPRKGENPDAAHGGRCAARWDQDSPAYDEQRQRRARDEVHRVVAAQRILEIAGQCRLNSFRSGRPRRLSAARSLFWFSMRLRRHAERSFQSCISASRRFSLAVFLILFG